MNDENPRGGVLMFASGVALGAVMTSVALAVVAAARPDPKPPPMPEVVCKAEACPACPSCPEPERLPNMPPVREPPNPESSEGGPQQQPRGSGPIDNGESVTERSCEYARTHPMQVNDAKLAACARNKMLGTCHLNGGCPTCACGEYAFVEDLCSTDGKCGAPLNGTGCVSSAFYGSSNSFFNCSGDNETVAGCMVRKLAKAGYCKRTQ
jgi:hypothetical protein